MRIVSCRQLLALVIIGVTGASPLSAQQSPGRSRSDTPLISAPQDPGRAAPSTAEQGTQNEWRSAPRFNSFSAGDKPSVSLENFTPPTLPVVVELFTSQGCSSCPAADQMLAALVNDPGILPLSFHVDYWDYLGWVDSFASPEFTKRQEGYARAAGERSVFTPQLIVGGQDTAVAPGPAQLDALIDAHRVAPALVSLTREVTSQGDIIGIIPLSELSNPVDIILIHYAPKRSVKIRSGENRGREITYVNVVLSLHKIADWEGNAPLRVKIQEGESADKALPDDVRHVILVQEDHKEMSTPGQILAAIRLD